MGAILSDKDDIDKIKKQELALIFSRFDEEIALKLGLDLRARAEAAGQAIAIDIRTWDRQLFGYAMPGTASNNQAWIARKANTVKRFHAASYRMALQHGEQGIPVRFGMADADFAFAGGGFPISVEGAGVIGCVTISGLPSRQDHELVVAALCAATGGDPDLLAFDLPAE